MHELPFHTSLLYSQLLVFASPAAVPEGEKGSGGLPIDIVTTEPAALHGYSAVAAHTFCAWFRGHHRQTTRLFLSLWQVCNTPRAENTSLGTFHSGLPYILYTAKSGL